MEDYYFGGGTQFIDISYLVPLGESNVLMTYLRGSKSEIYDDEDCLMDIDDSAKAELSNVRFFHEEEESGYITGVIE